MIMVDEDEDAFHEDWNEHQDGPEIRCPVLES